jgi:hypothetical protein
LRTNIRLDRVFVTSNADDCKSGAKILCCDEVINMDPCYWTQNTQSDGSCTTVSCSAAGGVSLGTAKTAGPDEMGNYHQCKSTPTKNGNLQAMEFCCSPHNFIDNVSARYNILKYIF